MALSDLDVENSLVANGVNTDFALNFPIIVDAEDEVQVWVRDESTTPPTETLQIVGADYSVDSVDVTFNVAPASGLKIILIRILPLTQTLDLELGSGVNLVSLETALDRIVAMIQQLDEALSRAPLLPITEQMVANPILPEPVASEIIGWNSAGTQLTSYSAAELLASGAASLQDHIDDATDAHDASAISNVPAGNLVSTNVQDALNEIQTEIDGLSPVTSEVQMTLANNQAATDVTGLVFDSSVYRAVEIKYTIERRTATQGYRSMGRLICMFEAFAGTWSIDDDVDAGSSGFDTGVTFTINATTGQIQYATDSMTGGTYVGKMRHVVNKRFAKET